MYAGLAGVLLALVFQRTVPEYFGMILSLEYLAMIVIGGLGSVAGAVIGAAFVSLLPQVLTHYSDSLPWCPPPVRAESHRERRPAICTAPRSSRSSCSCPAALRV